LWPAAGLAAGLTAVVALVILAATTRTSRILRQPLMPELVRVAAPSQTSTPPPTAPAPTAAPTTAGSTSAGTILVGDLVEVFGTDGDGVRLRENPSLDGAINGLGMDSEVFQVSDGPVEAAGYLWWYLVNPYDTNRQGWAVAEFLRPLQGS
jgi:hypothetical protein